MFRAEYLRQDDAALLDTHLSSSVCGGADGSASFEIAGTGHGTIEGFVTALQDHFAVDITVRDYVQATLRRAPTRSRPPGWSWSSAA